MKNKIDIFVVLRILIGGIFVVSGFEKIIAPYENFLYVVDEYKVLPLFLDKIVAGGFPWLELFTGIFLVLGFWTRYAAYFAGCFFLTFVGVIAQALIRDLPVADCGCFGELISFPLYIVLIMDACLLSLSCVLLYNHKKASKFGLDSLFNSEDE